MEGLAEALGGSFTCMERRTPKEAVMLTQSRRARAWTPLPPPPLVLAQFGSRWNGSLFAVLHTMPRRPEGWQDVHVAPLIDMGKPQRQRITHKNAQFI